MRIEDLIADGSNANRGTQRGRKVLGDSLKRLGAGRSVLVDKYGRLIAGNQTVSQASSVGITEVVIVPSDGSKLVAVQRTDLSLDDPKARELAIADNRTSELGLDWDPAILGEFSAELDLKPFFTDNELSQIIAPHIGSETGNSSSEVDVDAFTLTHRCPKCGFEFDDDK